MLAQKSEAVHARAVTRVERARAVRGPFGVPRNGRGYLVLVRVFLLGLESGARNRSQDVLLWRFLLVLHALFLGQVLEGEPRDDRRALLAAALLLVYLVLFAAASLLTYLAVGPRRLTLRYLVLPSRVCLIAALLGRVVAGDSFSSDLLVGCRFLRAPRVLFSHWVAV